MALIECTRKSTKGSLEEVDIKIFSLITDKKPVSKVLIYSEISWDFLEQRHHHLARFAVEQGMTVEFVQRVVSRVPSVREMVGRLWKRRAESSTKLVSKVVPRQLIIRSSLFLPPIIPLSGTYNWMLWFLLERPRQRNAIIYSFVNNPYVIGGDYPICAQHNTSVFDIIHNWWEFPWHKQVHRALVNNNVKLFDKIVTDSPVIAERLRSLNISPHIMLPGVGEEWLDIASSSTKISPVFFGNLRSNSDVELVKRMSAEHNTHLLGLIDETVAKSVGNAIYLGEFSTDELINEISNYNLVLLPYDQGEFSKTIAPAKYFEALATGALVVTGADMSHLPGFNDFVFRVDSLSQEALYGLQEAIVAQSKKRQAQVAFAGQHLWKTRFDDLFDFLEVE